MYLSLQLVVVGRSPDMIQAVIDTLEGQALLTLVPHLLKADQMLLPEYLRPVPDAIIFVMDDNWRQGVWDLIEKMPTPRPPLFVVSQSNDMECLRIAMRVGVRDVFPMPLQVEDTIATLSRVVQEERKRRGNQGSHLISFMNTKGGSGASLIASNVAMAMATEANYRQRLLLVDFDFQFGGLPTYLNLVARDGLIKAMEFVQTLDQAALQAYVQRHDNGLHLLAAAMDEIIVPDDISAERTELLLKVINQAYDNILIDLPHRIDPAIATILEHSDVIALITQQTVAHLHDTKRLMFLLRDRLGIAMDRIVLLLNRYDKKADVRFEDFQDVFVKVPIQTVPSDYLRASESLNLGIPICESAAESPIGKALLKLGKTLSKGESHTATSGPAPLNTSPTSTAKPEKKAGIMGWLKR
ncbi:MAG: AAA family ATPase [Chromatiaceae bacterium]